MGRGRRVGGVLFAALAFAATEARAEEAPKFEIDARTGFGLPLGKGGPTAKT